MPLPNCPVLTSSAKCKPLSGAHWNLWAVALMMGPRVEGKRPWIDLVRAGMSPAAAGPGTGLPRLAVDCGSHRADPARLPACREAGEQNADNRAGDCSQLSAGQSSENTDQNSAPQPLKQSATEGC